MLHCSQCLPEIISFQILFFLHINITTTFQSLIYICLVLSGCINYNRKFPCGNSLFRDKILTCYHHRIMSTWFQYQKSIASWIHHINNKRIQAPGRLPFFALHHPPTLEAYTRPTKNISYKKFTQLDSLS